MKLRELIELTRGLDDPSFIARFACPFLMEEGYLKHETRREGKNTAPRSEIEEIAERRVYLIRRRDGKSGDVTVGRGPQLDVQIEMKSVSTRHAVMKPPGDGRARWCVVDTVSTNGTFVDGVRIATGRDAELSDGTVIRFGPDLRLSFYEPHEFLRILRQLSRSLAEKAARGRVDNAAEVFDTTRNRALDQTETDESEEPGSVTERNKRPPAAAASPPPPRPAVTQPKKKPQDLAAVVGASTELDLPQPRPATPATEPPRPAVRSIATPARTPAQGSAIDKPTYTVLACDPFAPVALEPFRPILVGRVPGNHFVLPNPQVSRKHCEVERVREGITVKDLGSANGTFVDGKRIETRTLVPIGGSFSVGPYKLEVRAADSSPHLGSKISEGDTMVSKPQAAAEGLRGTFEDMPLSEILSGVEFNQKTGVIDIQGDAGIAGFVSFRAGAPQQARCGKLEGTPALLALLALTRGRFVLKSDEASVGPRAIEGSFTRILLEHGRRRDEKRKS
jgi:pSer/pThr/pTyr-binding forkhead associated (FHA) protein